MGVKGTARTAAGACKASLGGGGGVRPILHWQLEKPTAYDSFYNYVTKNNEEKLKKEE
ncbi:MAG: hypothetical protein MR278_02555 [Bacteroidales bacterium]|nr:hypothetical protein [Bacteroidales bacterium]